MVCFNKFFTSVFLAVVFASSSLAAPWPTDSKHATHRVRMISRDLQIETYHPESSYETYEDGIDHPLSKRADASLSDSAVSFVQSKLGLDSGKVGFKSGFEGETASHAFVKQTHDGIPFANAVANVAFSKDNKVVAFGSSFVKADKFPSSKPSVDLKDAISTAEGKLSGSYNNHPESLEWFAKDDGSVVLTHVVQIRNEKAGTWYEAFIDAHDNELVSITDFVAKASYKVLPITSETIDDGFKTLTDPADETASPKGWHWDGSSTTTDTSGNNAIAYKDSESSTTKQSSSGQNFVFTQDASKAPTTKANLNAARTNAFYAVNTVHDISYLYGFNEKAYNFQNDNFDKGGEGNDRVTISVQDSAGTDNADFSTPPDGQSGAMRMFLWDETDPERDGALENDIVVHENTHGITNRLTGGGTGRCLQATEGGGMGEGWSDAMAEWTEHKSEDVPDYVMGQYVVNDAAGIRTHPYSTSKTTNPLTYGSVKKLNEVHNIGEVWANILHNVYAALVKEYGFSKTAHTDPSGTEGNVVFLHLFIDQLPLQPCNPKFTDARDAWIQADKNRYDGKNKCLLWKAFASRGLGQNAKDHVDDSTVPSGC
ncbi:hypothetical protein PLICRDRAFT_173122 [Plicaturopsis crispa FD-325 SS-3]|nr:hypothetical protein PLICRDRAFT_173122 [Plicaturopsis crispa FD-325 SS-3]